MNTFDEFGLAEPITRALRTKNYVTPTPIQAQTIPLLMSGSDVVGIAQTGTGKTAAFALPILHRFALKPRPTQAKTCRALILSPTRELSGQILESFRAYGRHLGLHSALVIGGVPIGRQMRATARGVDILVATPGRLLDLMHEGAMRLDQVEVFVLDEADRMLDMGFIRDIRKIIAKLPAQRQTLLFSATMPQAISELAGQMLKNPARVSVTPIAKTADRVSQQIMHVDRAGKAALLAKLLRGDDVERALIFTRTKHGADKVVRGLVKSGIAAEAIHGNKSQNQRERVLAAFREGKVRMLVATDIAARGIDVAGISHVFNYDLPVEPEAYVHRIGRTARAGAEGIAISFCSHDEKPALRAIERLIRMTIPADGAPALPHEETPHNEQRPQHQGARREGRPHQWAPQRHRDGRQPQRHRDAAQPQRHRDAPQPQQHRRHEDAHSAAPAPAQSGGPDFANMPFMQQRAARPEPKAPRPFARPHER